MALSSLALIKRKKQARKHNIKQDYFTREIDEHILKFIKTRSDSKRNEIFETKIKKAFTSLVNNLIFVYKASDLDTVSSLRDDCVRFLYTKIDTYDCERASKAFSYFNVVARNWLFQRFNSNKKDEKKFLDINDSQVTSSLVYKSKEDYDSEQLVFFDKDFINYIVENLSDIKLLFKEREQAVLDAILMLLKNPDSIDIYNKKAIFIYIRNMTGYNAKQVALSISKLKTEYFELKKAWIKNTEITDN